MDEIVKEFLIESYENLDCLDRDLVALEKDPHAKETLASIFRTIHTLKGVVAFLASENWKPWPTSVKICSANCATA